MRHLGFLGIFLILSGCGGGGSGSSWVSIPEDATGLWAGHLAVAGGGVYHMGGLFIEGNLYLFTTDGLYTDLRAGTYAISGDRLEAETIDYDLFTGLPLSTSAFSGHVETQVNLSGSYVSTSGEYGTFSLDYSPENYRGASLISMSSNWVSKFSVATVSIDTLGNFSSSNITGCAAYGTVRVPDPSTNLYRLTLTMTSCGMLDGVYTGYAFLTDDVAYNDTLVYIVRNATNTVIFDMMSRS